MSKVFHKGIDVSEHQGVISWEMVKADGVEFVIPRVGYGFAHEDNIFAMAISGAQENHIDIPAVYHFSYAVSEDAAKSEAEFVIKQCKKYGLPKSTIIFYDFEYDSKRYFDSCEMKKPAKNRTVLTPKMVQKFTKAFCDTVEAAGYIPGVYFNQDYFKNWYNLGTTFKDSWIKWLADYEGEPNFPCEFRQTSSTGVVAGISSRVDTDVSYFDYKSLVKVEEKPKEKSKPVLKSNDEIAKEVIAGKWGNGNDRKTKLTNAGYDYNAVQSIVNKLLAESNPKKKVTDEVVNDVIAGKYGNGDDRKNKLEAAGYVYKEVQDAVNKKLSSSAIQASVEQKVSPAQSFDNSLSANFKVVAAALNLRYIPGLLTENNVVKILHSGDIVRCWGYYTQKSNSKWLLVQVGSVTGFVDSNYLTRA